MARPRSVPGRHGWPLRSDPTDHADLEEAAPGHIKTFEALACDSHELANGASRGREMLALLKGDVDRFGQLFAAGLGDTWSIPRAGALSRIVDAYFSLLAVSTPIPIVSREAAKEAGRCGATGRLRMDGAAWLSARPQCEGRGVEGELRELFGIDEKWRSSTVRPGRRLALRHALYRNR